MQVNPDLFSDVLDTLSFFFVTPGLIGETRLQNFGRTLRNVSERLHVRLIELSKTAPKSLSSILIKIGVTALVIVWIWIPIHYLTGIDLDQYEWGRIIGYIGLLCFSLAFLQKPITIIFGTAIRAVVSFLGILVTLISRYNILRIMLFIGFVLFIISRVIQVHHHLVSNAST